MRSADIAYLLSVLDCYEGPYKRKRQVRKELQDYYDRTRKSKAKAISIRVTTQHSEAAASEKKGHS